MKTENSLPKIKNREVFVKVSEHKKIDYAETLAKIITDGNVAKWLAEKGLLSKS